MSELTNAIAPNPANTCGFTTLNGSGSVSKEIPWDAALAGP